MNVPCIGRFPLIGALSPDIALKWKSTNDKKRSCESCRQNPPFEDTYCDMTHDMVGSHLYSYYPCVFGRCSLWTPK